MRVTQVLRGGVKRYPYPKAVWSPAGGWWPEPVHWKRNTVIAFAMGFALCVPVMMISSANEKSLTPNRPIPSTAWRKHGPMDQEPKKY
eukprot:Clim_evm110s109 gene=Clim_evmTU110s109